MKRIFESDKKDQTKVENIKKNELGNLIPNLSDFYQIFIDNLNAEDISLLEIIDYSLEDLYKKFVKLDNIFIQYIDSVFSYFFLF